MEWIQSTTVFQIMKNKIKKLSKTVGQMPDRKCCLKCDYYRDQIGILYVKHYSVRQISDTLRGHKINIHYSTLSRYLLRKSYTNYEKQKYKEEIQRINDCLTCTGEKLSQNTSIGTLNKTINIEKKKIKMGLTAEEIYQKYDARRTESDCQKEIERKLELMGRKKIYTVEE